MNIPTNIKYSNDHEWIRIDGDHAVIGVTDFAQKELGDIVFIEVETVGESLGRQDTFGTIEAVKTVSDLFMPVAGDVIEFNERLEDKPELINQDPYGEGWIIKARIHSPDELDDLLNAVQYQEIVNE